MFSIAGRTKLMRCDGCAFRKKIDMHIKKKRMVCIARKQNEENVI